MPIATTFHRFSELSAELRLQVWEYFTKEPPAVLTLYIDTIYQRAYPIPDLNLAGVLGANRESRDAIIRRLKPYLISIGDFKTRAHTREGIGLNNRPVVAFDPDNTILELVLDSDEARPNYEPITWTVLEHVAGSILMVAKNVHFRCEDANQLSELFKPRRSWSPVETALPNHKLQLLTQSPMSATELNSPDHILCIPWQCDCLLRNLTCVDVPFSAMDPRYVNWTVFGEPEFHRYKKSSLHRRKITEGEGFSVIKPYYESIRLPLDAESFNNLRNS
jgi:hypothetical protein